jgi:hypothetical protein
VRLGEKATAVLRRLEERPGFPVRNSRNRALFSSGRARGSAPAACKTEYSIVKLNSLVFRS